VVAVKHFHNGQPMWSVEKADDCQDDFSQIRGSAVDLGPGTMASAAPRRV
jgi:hypothetical protein